ncbi:MAG: hypothetical protein IKX20_08935 [Paludibacteraceae bacterium]|nr:hypothetical protein [Paludibacteraceae bacterium]
MKEIGSFIELELPKGQEWYGGDKGVARLNTGRAAIWHAFRLTGASAIWLPYYQCETVRQFLQRKHCEIKYYHQDRDFNPIDLTPSGDEAVLFVNYFGVMSFSRMETLAQPFCNVIIDNCQAFFCPPVPGTYSVYSARKFHGVADGAYVIGPEAERFVDEYPQSYSSDTAVFLLKRIEYGCEGAGYESRTINEDRIDSEDIMKMSYLTHAMLDGADYQKNRAKRKENYRTACDLFDGINLIKPSCHLAGDTIPMVYPLVIEDENLHQCLLKAKHFQGHWWNYITKEMPESTFEYWLSKYLIPITIDQRYGESEIRYVHSVVECALKHRI